MVSNRVGPIALVYGTRPQVIKASRLLPALARLGPVVAVDSGQHYDFELNGLLYRQLGVPPADRYLDVGSGPLAEQTAAIMTRTAAIYREFAPRAVVVIGDTITTLGAGLAAAQQRIPLVHVEAGLRVADSQMAEEIARRAIDHIAQVLCAPSARSGSRLEAEGVGGAVEVTGDIARDVLDAAKAAGGQPLASRAWPIDLARPFVLATLHRAELVDSPADFRDALEGLAAIRLPVIWPVHPRARTNLDRFDLAPQIGPNIHLFEPLGYFETLALVEAAAVVVTDSGGVQRESYWLGTPCITVRTETEWTETVDVGANRLCPPGRVAGTLAAAINEATSRSVGWSRDAFGSGDAASRIGAAISRHLGPR